jgi:serine/threonine protein phosphatase PrpC
MRYLASHAQHIGSRRYQQDSFGFADLEDGEFLEHAGFLSVLCDGMGGMEHGDLASETAVRAMLNAYALKTPAESIPQALERSVREANQRVIEAAARTGSREGVGTTLVAAVVHKFSLYFISVGDSAVFHVTQGHARMVNRHHVFANLLDRALASGKISQAEAEQHPEREALTSFIGIRQLDEIDRNLEPRALEDGDIVLLASDGMFKTLDSEQIAACLRQGPALSWPQVLVDRAIGSRAPGQDNITVLAIQPHGGENDPVPLPMAAPRIADQPSAAPAVSGSWWMLLVFLVLVAIGAAGYWFLSRR